jgi:hypothetical protein
MRPLIALLPILVTLSLAVDCRGVEPEPPPTAESSPEVRAEPEPEAAAPVEDAPPSEAAPEEEPRPEPPAAPEPAPQDREDPVPAPQPDAGNEEEPPEPEPKGEPGAEPEPKPKPPVKKPVVSDPQAVALLRKAAERQGAKALAAAGALRSFHVGFFKAKFKRERVNSQGARETIGITADTRSLRIDWMAPDNLRTEWAVDGKRNIRGYHAGRKLSWTSDGSVHTLLGKEDKRHLAERDQIARDRDMIRSLLDVAFLSRMLADGSVWKSSKAPYPIRSEKDETRVEDAATLVAIARRRKTAEDPQVPLTLWLDKETHEVRAAAVDTGPDTYPLVYGLAYHEKFPQVVWSGGKARFPFKVNVYDSPDSPPVMQLFVETVHVNDDAKVSQKTFGLPR